MNNSIYQFKKTLRRIARKQRLNVDSWYLYQRLDRAVRRRFFPLSLLVDYPNNTIFVPYFQIFSRPGTYSEKIFGWKGEHHSLLPVKLIAEQPFEFSFRPLEGGFLGVHIKLGTYNRYNTCKICVEVYCYDSGQPILLSKSVRSADSIIDNQLNYFPFSKNGFFS